MMKKQAILLLAAAMTLGTGITAHAQYRAALLIVGTLGDKGFWDSAYNGLNELEEELGEDVFSFDVQEMGRDTTGYLDYYLDACEEDYDLIVTGTWESVNPLNEAMEEYPDQKFLMFDDVYDFSEGKGKNLYNLLFKQNEVSYLVGAEAALISETGIISFLGGTDGNVINDFLVGYIQGAMETNPDVQVAVSFVGNYDDSAKGKDLALAMYTAGADVGFNVAGGAGMGILEAANEVGKLAFGVNTDQAGENPDLADAIPTSALKNVGVGVARAIKLDMNGELEFGISESLGLAEGVVGLLDDDHYREMVPEDVREQVQELSDRIASGEIEVLTSYNMNTQEIDELKAQVALH